MALSNYPLYELQLLDSTVIRNHKEDIELNQRRLLNSVPFDFKKGAEVLTDRNADIYKYRMISSDYLDLCLDIINQAIKLYPSYLERIKADNTIPTQVVNSKIAICNNLDPYAGYSKSRMITLVLKLSVIIPMILKNLGRYDKYQYLNTLSNDQVKEFAYKNITYVSSTQLKEAFGENSATDYNTILEILEIVGVIKRPHHHWSFVTKYTDEYGVYHESGRAIAKMIYVTPEFINKYNACGNDQILIPSHGLYNDIINRLEGLDEVHMMAIHGLTQLVPSDQIYQAAKSRLKYPAVQFRIAEFQEELDDADPKKWERYDKVDVMIYDANDNAVKTISMAYNTALLAIALYEGDLMTLLRFTIDDYSGRFHTALTRLSSEVRTHLKFANGENAVDIDIRACQPMLFCSLLGSFGYDEIGKFVGDHDFYEKFESMMQEKFYDSFEFKNSEQRDNAKLEFVRTSYSTGGSFLGFVRKSAQLIESISGTEKAHKYKELMYQLADGESELNERQGFYVPDITRRINTGYEMRCKSSSLPKRLQSAEVNIVFGKNGVLNRLIQAGVPTCTTIHDAIIVPESYAEIANSIMKSTFIELTNCSKYGFDVATHCDILRPTNQGDEYDVTYN